jgi:hypothetical protein
MARNQGQSRKDLNTVRILPRSGMPDKKKHVLFNSKRPNGSPPGSPDPPCLPKALSPRLSGLFISGPERKARTRDDIFLRISQGIAPNPPRPLLPDAAEGPAGGSPSGNASSDGLRPPSTLVTPSFLKKISGSSSGTRYFDGAIVCRTLISP